MRRPEDGWGARPRAGIAWSCGLTSLTSLTSLSSETSETTETSLGISRCAEIEAIWSDFATRDGRGLGSPPPVPVVFHCYSKGAYHGIKYTFPAASSAKTAQTNDDGRLLRRLYARISDD
jgi:hypothetical protein